mmetsp:Transcript_101274/g.283906  ORF Transcript_101274/g.283906 Transcript_101274/m.283906 type:complete len:382 (+) Transcript_101274:663-1808(+)
MQCVAHPVHHLAGPACAASGDRLDHLGSLLIMDPRHTSVLDESPRFAIEVVAGRHRRAHASLVRVGAAEGSGRDALPAILQLGGECELIDEEVRLVPQGVPSQGHGLVEGALHLPAAHDLLDVGEVHAARALARAHDLIQRRIRAHDHVEVDVEKNAVLRDHDVVGMPVAEAQDEGHGVPTGARRTEGGGQSWPVGAGASPEVLHYRRLHIGQGRRSLHDLQNSSTRAQRLNPVLAQMEGRDVEAQGLEVLAERCVGKQQVDHVANGVGDQLLLQDARVPLEEQLPLALGAVLFQHLHPELRGRVAALHLLRRLLDDGGYLNIEGRHAEERPGELPISNSGTLVNQRVDECAGLLQPVVHLARRTMRQVLTKIRQVRRCAA